MHFSLFCVFCAFFNRGVVGNVDGLWLKILFLRSNAEIRNATIFMKYSLVFISISILNLSGICDSENSHDPSTLKRRRDKKGVGLRKTSP